MVALDNIAWNQQLEINNPCAPRPSRESQGVGMFFLLWCWGASDLLPPLLVFDWPASGQRLFTRQSGRLGT